MEPGWENYAWLYHLLATPQNETLKSDDKPSCPSFRILSAPGECASSLRTWATCSKSLLLFHASQNCEGAKIERCHAKVLVQNLIKGRIVWAQRYISILAVSDHYKKRSALRGNKYMGSWLLVLTWAPIDPSGCTLAIHRFVLRMYCGVTKWPFSCSTVFFSLSSHIVSRVALWIHRKEKRFLRTREHCSLFLL